MKEKTNLINQFGILKFEVMPFGLMNAPSTFKRIIDYIFSDCDFVGVYSDDVFVF